MKLPREFLEKMKMLLGEAEYLEYVDSLKMPRTCGLRVNTLKISVDEFVRISPVALEPVPWTQDGFYYPDGENPGRHPYYFAGLYYIQEPSAMLPGVIMDSRPGECILDLCAAPGGKTVQIAAGMQGRGLLVANDINSERVKALVRNIEACGVRNAIVTNESSTTLANRFACFFDKILVDAPCSGEGMFRKDEDSLKSWERYKSDRCAAMQQDILQDADRMLKPGGRLVYSTCTFSPEENEKIISQFVKRTGYYRILDIPKADGLMPGRPEWSDGDPALAGTVRLWPHRVRGEGHFVALLKKEENLPVDTAYMGDIGQGNSSGKGRLSGRDIMNTGSISEMLQREVELFNEFVASNLKTRIEGFFYKIGNNLYCLPSRPPDLIGIKVAKFGWYLGQFLKGRFEPSHSLAVSLKKNDFANTIDLSANSKEVQKYLKGETLVMEGKNGLMAVCVDGYPLGWAKQAGEMIKNLYPAGWRKMK